MIQIEEFIFFVSNVLRERTTRAEFDRSVQEIAPGCVQCQPIMRVECILSDDDL